MRDQEEEENKGIKMTVKSNAIKVDEYVEEDYIEEEI